MAEKLSSVRNGLGLTQRSAAREDSQSFTGTANDAAHVADVPNFSETDREFLLALPSLFNPSGARKVFCSEARRHGRAFRQLESGKRAQNGFTGPFWVHSCEMGIGEPSKSQ